MNNGSTRELEADIEVLEMSIKGKKTQYDVLDSDVKYVWDIITGFAVEILTSNEYTNLY